MADISLRTKLFFLISISLIAIASVAVLAFIAAGGGLMNSGGPTEVRGGLTDNRGTPKLSSEVVADGLDHPWEIAFLPSRAMLITERSGLLSLHENGKRTVIADIEDVYATGEGGLMGLEVDTKFETNNFIYTCYASIENDDVRLMRWKLSADQQRLENGTPIVSGIPLNPSGRHSGCRVKMSDENLWIGTGDAAIGTNPQDPRSLGGKILRVTRDGNPMGSNFDFPFDPRIYSYGHRNTQGIALYETSAVAGVSPGRIAFGGGFSVEHGSSVDDEVNPLLPGNFGWDPAPLYNESVPMTDSEKFVGAIKSVWSSGNPTIAPSGASFLSGEQWQSFDGALAVAFLKGEQLRIQKYGVAKDGDGFKSSGALALDEIFFEGDFGRLRSAVQGPDGSLYVTTDNGGGRDQIIKITPQSR